eukprot:636356-Pleurochrysis_carterae.AAC.2
MQLPSSTGSQDAREQRGWALFQILNSSICMKVPRFLTSAACAAAPAPASNNRYVGRRFLG